VEENQMRMLCLLFIAGCSLTPSGTSGDTNSAQSFLPDLAGYTETDARNVTDALSSLGGNAADLIGNPLVEAAITRIDGMMSCYQDVGAVAARVYTQADIGTILTGETPKIGALAVINEDRLRDNFLACSVGSQGLSAQAASVEPCGGSGTTTRNGQTIHYIYGATDPELCTLFQQNFQ
jgi:hypothetical protein